MQFWIKNIIILTLGLSSCGGSYYTGKSSIHKLMNWEKESAKIAPARSKTSKAVVSFNYSGNVYTFHPYTSTTNTTGTAIFPKEDPDKAELLDYKKFLMVPLFLAVLGLILIVIGFFSMQNRIAGKNVPAPSHDATAHYQALKDYVDKKDSESSRG